MTGFGRAEIARSDWTMTFEVKSVNSRFLDLKWRLPASLRSLESGFEKIVREIASRGRVDIYLNLQVTNADLLGMRLNGPLAESMFDQLDELARIRNIEYAPDLTRLLGFSFLWQESSAEPDPRLVGDLEETLREALTEWDRSRAREGDALVEDLSARVGAMKEMLAHLERLTPQVVEERTEVLSQRIAKVLESLEAQFDEQRMLQEAAILADRLDVSEELTRLATHLDRLDELVRSDGDVGKRADFLLQEVFREINTCGNKAQHTDVSRIVIDFKAELEKCREQVQNIE
jgi:uncharacterized protein (TIGR00255 family)